MTLFGKLSINSPKSTGTSGFLKFCKTSLAFAPLLIAAVSVYFNIRIPINSEFAYFLGEKKDFTINFLYLSDILVLCTIPYLFKAIFQKNSLNKGFIGQYLLLTILLVAILSYLVHFADLTLPIISIFYLLYVAKFIVLHETAKRFSSKLKSLVLVIIWIFGLFQAFISIIQFGQQGHVGLRLLGEPFFGPYMWGVAKVEALGQIFTRPYGSFLHPNILSAFLMLSLVVGTYYYYMHRSNSDRVPWFKLFLLQINLLALFISFSRAAWLATALVFTLMHVFTWNIFGYAKLKLITVNLATSVAFLCLLLIILQPFIKQRGNVFDKAYQERKSYNQAAVAMIAANPVLGSGPGESVLHMEQALGLGVQPWEIQPIHNYYLLLAAEIGLPALLLLLLYLAKSIKSAYLATKEPSKHGAFQQAILLSGLLGCLLLMLFDHYFYTIQATIILFWVWLGLTNSHSVSAKSALPK